MYQDPMTKDEATKQLESDISGLELDITNVTMLTLEKELNGASRSNPREAVPKQPGCRRGGQQRQVLRKLRTA